MSAEALGRIPEDIQHELLQIARTAAGMSEVEKGAALLLFTNRAMVIDTDGHHDLLEAADMVAALSRIVWLTAQHAADQAEARAAAAPKEL